MSSATTRLAVAVLLLGGALLSACTQPEHRQPLPNVIANLRRSVVRIEVIAREHECRIHPFGPADGDYFGAPTLDGCLSSSIGSGVAVESGGLILTNHHVVANAVRIRVITSTGAVFSAHSMGSDPVTDLAVLRVDGPAPPPAQFARPGSLRVGDSVYALGVPFGLDLSASSGIVSALPQDDETDLLQTDVPLNPGNSGGPLVDSAGDIVGINVSILAHGQGISFAIPGSRALEICQVLKANGRVVRGTIGVEVQPLSEEIASLLSLQDPVGVLVAGVQSGGAAERAGLVRGDAVRAVASEAITRVEQFEGLIRAAAPGQSLQFRLERQRKTMEVKVIVDELRGPTEPMQRVMPGHELGFGVMNLTDEIAERMSLPPDLSSRVIVVSLWPDSNAAEAGLREGDVILEVDRQPVHDVGEFRQVMTDRIVPGDKFLLLVQRGARSRYVVITLRPGTQ